MLSGFDKTRLVVVKVWYELCDGYSVLAANVNDIVFCNVDYTVATTAANVLPF